MTLRLPRWQVRAACRDRPDLDFIDPGGQLAHCLALCAGCPVTELCLAAAIEGDEVWGIWGGLDPDEREQIAAQAGLSALVIKPTHGTHTRYAKHRCRCDLCREAHNAYNQRRRAARKATIDSEAA